METLEIPGWAEAGFWDHDGFIPHLEPLRDNVEGAEGGHADALWGRGGEGEGRGQWEELEVAPIQ